MKGKELGQYGESYTAKYLEKQGFSIVQRNYHCRYGEVDLIAKGEELLLFVEVKTREYHAIATPREAVTKAKQEKVKKTAESFLQMFPQYNTLQPRFDVAEITLNENERKLYFSYYKNAFC